MSRPAPIPAAAAVPFKLGHFLAGRHVAGMKGSVRWIVLAVALAGSAYAWTAGQPMVLVPAGVFTMGASASNADRQQKPAHEVFIDAFEIDRTEVTVGDYKKCIVAGVCGKITSPEPGFVSDAEYFATFESDEPMREVSWSDADRYCRWIGKRLPTEAEWEKAARGPKGYINPWGDRPFKKGDAAIGVDSYYRAGEFANDKSGYGVADTAGNVMEWVADWYLVDYYRNSPSRNPTGPTEGTKKVVRGASASNTGWCWFNPKSRPRLRCKANRAMSCCT